MKWKLFKDEIPDDDRWVIAHKNHEGLFLLKISIDEYDSDKKVLIHKGIYSADSFPISDLDEYSFWEYEDEIIDDFVMEQCVVRLGQVMAAIEMDKIPNKK